MAKVNVVEVISNSKFNRFHLGLFIWSFMIILFDGYDLSVYGTALPLIMEDWNLTSVQAGTMASYGLFGMVFGAIIFGILADRIGRKKVIIINVFIFSLFTLLCAFADSATTFSIFRFIAGLGLGGIMPNIAALVSDYAPRTMRIKLVSLTLVSFAVGGALAPTVGVLLIQTFGWGSVFITAGLPLLGIPFMMKQLPDSASYLIRAGKKEELFATLAKVSPGSTFNMDDEIVVAKVTQAKVPVAGLFKENRALSTIGFWVAFFCALLMVYGLNTWLPKLMIDAGYGLNSSLTFLIALQGGAVIGILALSNLCEKYGSKRVIIIYCRCHRFSVTRVWWKYILYFRISSDCRGCYNRVSSSDSSLCNIVLPCRNEINWYRYGFRNWPIRWYDWTEFRWFLTNNDFT